MGMHMIHRTHPNGVAQFRFTCIFTTVKCEQQQNNQNKNYVRDIEEKKKSCKRRNASSSSQNTIRMNMDLFHGLLNIFNCDLTHTN